MFHDFALSWSLFHHTSLVGWLIGLSLSIVGVLVVARDQIFLGAAVSQASTLGIALAMRMGWMLAGSGLVVIESEVFLSGMSVAICVLASLFTWHRGKSGKESHEATTGWVFLLSASFSILVVSKSPHGLEEIHRLLSSSIIGATAEDVWVLGVLAASTLLFISLCRRPVLLLAMDPAMAVAVGLNTNRWGVIISIWLGLAAGLSIRSAGMLYTFGCLVLPALIAKNLCREVLSMFIVSPCVALSVSAFGFVAANHWDYPPGQMTVAFLCLALAAAWIIRSMRDGK
jgi:ABC-type Mn2+/Zn2+ transport system permease subunit